jgi:hypothetical protein
MLTGGFDTCTCVLVQVYARNKRSLLNHQINTFYNNSSNFPSSSKCFRKRSTNSFLV